MKPVHYPTPPNWVAFNQTGRAGVVPDLLMD